MGSRPPEARGAKPFRIPSLPPPTGPHPVVVTAGSEAAVRSAGEETEPARS